MALQHRIYLTTNTGLTQTLIRFACKCAQTERSIHHPTDSRLMVLPPASEHDQPDIIEQWSLFYRAFEETFNQLAFELELTLRNRVDST